MKPKFRPYSGEEYSKMFDQAFAKFGTLVKKPEEALSSTDEQKTYEVTFHKTKKI